jgi:5-formyltetrahydrofolate cyclo-ligase
VDKESLRKQYSEYRMNISRSAYWRLTDEIKTVHIFLPIRRYNEIDTFSIINYFSIQYPDIHLVIPRSDFRNYRIENILYDHNSTILVRNKYDIPEPVYGKVIDPYLIDLVFVPLLACDLNGNRVGYGKGFYDRFLKQCRRDVLNIGLCFFDPVNEISDVNESDQSIDACLTPGRIWRFNDALIPFLHSDH